MKSKKPARMSPRPRRGAPVVDEASFAVILEDIRAQFRVFGEALQELPTRREMHEALDSLRDELRVELRGELYSVRDELRTEMGELRTEMGELRTEMGELRTEMGEIRVEMGEMRTDVSLLKTAVLDLAKRIP